MTVVGWDSKLSAALGAKAAAKLGEHLSLWTVGDLLSHYPRTFLEMGQVSSLGELTEGDPVLVVADVRKAEVIPYQDRRTNRTRWRTEVSARLGDGEIWLTFFDRNRGTAGWRVEQQLRPGRRVVLSGRFGRNSYRRGRWELAHPEVHDVGEEVALFKPVYPVSGAVTSQEVEQSVRVVLDVVSDIPERIPATLRDQHGLLDAARAMQWIHRPADWQQHGAAAKRLRFDEAFVAQVALAQLRHQQQQVAGRPRTGRPGGLLDAFAGRMPFALTAGQEQVEKQILADLGAAHPMHRLLQGEVGSGKTVVALRAMLRVVDSGGQAALLAPTEVLAQQHHRSVTAMLGDLAGGGMLGSADDATTVALLTGSMPAAARKAALLAAASGEAGIVIGTHALLQERVQFADLGLVVVDEQHRFGVAQRAALTAKSADPPHVLVMTATPIPRTVAMTVFGDLETSALAELPAGRRPIQTTVVPLGEQPSWFDRVWARVREEVERGRQAYVVCPRISDTDGTTDDDEAADLSEEDADRGGSGRSRPPMAAVAEVAPRLAEGPLAGLRVGMLHGRLPAEDKDEVMRSFADGEVDVLVSTTVIEVGVDVGNATTMVVLDADRFGISQLHQLRGRVGRGGHPGLCLLVTQAAAGSPARERLDAVAGTLDGFRLAELDLLQRREGDVLGSAQSGSRRRLRLLSVARDGDVIEAARAAAVAVVQEDADLDRHPALRTAVADLHRDEAASYLDKG